MFLEAQRHPETRDSPYENAGFLFQEVPESSLASQFFDGICDGIFDTDLAASHLLQSLGGWRNCFDIPLRKNEFDSIAGEKLKELKNAIEKTYGR
jgi:hypothetical protein